MSKRRDEKDTFGINMIEWCRNHETYVLTAPATEELLAVHREKIRILQHERLAHLIVTVMVIFAKLFVVDLVLLHPELGIVPAIVMLGLAVLLGFYFYHYFVLENTHSETRVIFFLLSHEKVIR